MRAHCCQCMTQHQLAVARLRSTQKHPLLRRQGQKHSLPPFPERTWSSASLKTATVRTPILLAVCMILHAISPLFATSILSKGRSSEQARRPAGSSAAPAAAARDAVPDAARDTRRRVKHRTLDMRGEVRGSRRLAIPNISLETLNEGCFFGGYAKGARYATRPCSAIWLQGAQYHGKACLRRDVRTRNMIDSEPSDCWSLSPVSWSLKL